MSLAIARAVLLGTIVAGFGAQAWAMLAPLAQVRPAAVPVASAERDTAGGISTASDSLLAEAVRRPMFRMGRRPAAVPFDPERTDARELAAAPAVPKPALQVSGIVWGAEPAVVIEGLPGVEGPTVLRKGESVSGIRVLRIERERVLLRGLDTAWSLSVREPWK